MHIWGHDAWPAIDYPANVWVRNLDGKQVFIHSRRLDIVDGIVVEPDAFGRGGQSAPNT
jgi:hypothetical protein